jgi:(2Fe-2S) ferredoxin
MNEPIFHIFVCTNLRTGEECLPSCGPRGASSILEKFREEIRLRGLAAKVKVTATGCLTPCTHGPNVVVYPAGAWYCNVQASDISGILEAHIAGKIVERLLLPKEIRLL